ncbi:MAG: hypothetical protein JXB47_20750, partial [Anaerolineae bacterium]|nr:hypothetical protein [Anaerolineae bacterium]
TAAQYAQAVKDALGDLASRAPALRTATLETVAGQAEYALPDDFLRLVSLTTYSGGAGEVLVTGEGLVPLGRDGYRETVEVSGNTLTLVPTPTFDADRTLRYAVRYVLNESDEYTTLDEDRARVALLKAESIALRWIANAVTRQAWSYTVAEERVDKQKQAAEFRTCRVSG